MVSSCGTRSEPLSIEVPAGLITVTDAQAQLVAGVKTLSRGMSLEDVKQQLGRPSEEKSDLLFYNLVEGAEGGHYVAARLSFDNHGLSNAQLAFGHVSHEPRIED